MDTLSLMFASLSSVLLTQYAYLHTQVAVRVPQVSGLEGEQDASMSYLAALGSLQPAVAVVRLVRLEVLVFLEEKLMSV